VEIEEGHKPLITFTVGPTGIFEYNRLDNLLYSKILGLSNARAIYQCLMEQMLRYITTDGHRFCQIYLDDVIIVSKSFQEHMDHLTIVFDRIRGVWVKLSPKKCHLFRDNVNMLYT